MAKLKKSDFLPKIQEFIEAGYLIGELPEKTTAQELKGLVSAVEELLNAEGEPNPINLEEYFEVAEEDKQWYIKDEFFNKKKFGVDKSGNFPVKVETPVNYYTMTFSGNNKQTFYKDKPLTEEQVLLFNTPPLRFKEDDSEKVIAEKKKKGDKVVKFWKEKYLVLK